MPEKTPILYNFTEIAEMMVKKEKIQSGYWGVFVKFGIGAANIQSSNEGQFLPAAIVPVLEIGIQRFDEPNNLTVDAALVNVGKTKTTRTQQKKKTR